MRFRFSIRHFASGIFAALFIAACAGADAVQAPTATDSDGQSRAATPAAAETFVEEAQEHLAALAIDAARAAWVRANFITYDTQIISAREYEKLVSAAVDYATRASRFDDVPVSEDLRRKLDILKRGLTMPSPADPEKTAELTMLDAELEGLYGAGEYCPDEGACMDLEALEDIINYSREPDSLLMAWTGWRTVSVPMRDSYERFVELMNEGARELGYSDTGELWRSGYDMEGEAFAAELDRLWDQVRPLYESLHCYVRDKLADYYGDALVSRSEPIPAHLLGNMWAQEWENLFPIVAPPDADPGYDITQILQTRDISPIEMTRIAERFFTSLGMDPLPETFWDRSLFVQPVDHSAVCHASAWNVDYKDDLRMKMCIQQTAEDFKTIHHELGHNFYQRAYNQQPYLYQEGANDGFHEALGDVISLSVTPPYLKEIGLIDEEPPASSDLGLLLRDALDKVAFLPFGLLIDKWRWQVFSGEISPDEYNAGWWQLREQYQGVKAPVERSEANFDPGAKYHIPGNTPYARYFLAHILEFQFHRELCRAAGYKGPLNRCTIYGSDEAGQRLNDMMAMGSSRPWPEALAVLTGGQSEMDATAVLEYFAPLQAWLDEQNEGLTCGW